ncbi:hypothetical protein RJT34_06493 [Clitoria ternatea]|uniref:Uncharacterized protein n=1 Tax=Clitoria ternatea TaxID=43366 RepID=A0AAN9K471_CLITE
MAVAARGGRGGSGFRSLFSFRIFISAMFSLLFVATLSVLFTTNPSTSNDGSALAVKRSKDLPFKPGLLNCSACY